VFSVFGWQPQHMYTLRRTRYWSPQVNGSLDQAACFVDFFCTQVKAVSEHAHTSNSRK
jgi:hypothetical protein